MNGRAEPLRLMRWSQEDRDAFVRFTGTMTALQARIRETWGTSSGMPVPRPPEEGSLVDRARALLAQAETRAEAAGEHAALFAAPAWDLMLTLFVADGEGRRVPFAELPHGVAASLVAHALIADDAGIARLTDAATAMLVRCLEAL